MEYLFHRLNISDSNVDYTLPCVNQLNKRHDFLTIFSSEILDLIFSQFSVKEYLCLTTVSKTWRKFLLDRPHMWTNISLALSADPCQELFTNSKLQFYARHIRGGQTRQLSIRGNTTFNFASVFYLLRNWNCAFMKYLDISNAAFRKKAPLKGLELVSNNLVKLKFTQTNLSLNTALKCALRHCPQLEYFGYSGYTIAGAPKSLDIPPNQLTHLELSIKEMNDSAHVPILSILQGCLRLKYLCLMLSEPSLTTALKYLALPDTCPELESLTIDKPATVLPVPRIPAYSPDVVPGLSFLHLNAMSSFDANDIVNLIKRHHKALKHLSLYISSFHQNHIHLEDFILSPIFPQIRSLHLNWYPLPSVENGALIMGSQLIHNFAFLETLRFTDTMFLSNNLRYLCSQSKLKRLYLRNCDFNEIGGIDKTFCRFEGHFPLLEEISLESCAFVTDDFTRILCRSKALTIVTISHCRNITDHAITCLMHKHGTPLKHLNVSHCEKISLPVVQNLEQHSRKPRIGYQLFSLFPHWQLWT